MAYLISFELAKPEDNYNDFHKAINKATSFWMKPLPTMYLVKSKLNSRELYEKLIVKLTKYDRLFVIEVDSWPAAYIDGDVANELENLFDKQD